MKFIPDSYLRASVKDRFALLQGLIDTDGRIVESGYMAYFTTSVRLADDVTFLVQSLGGHVKRHVVRNRTFKPFTGIGRKDERPARDLFRLSIILDSDVPPARGRRAARFRKRRYKSASRRIVSIMPAGTVETRCISVDSPDGLYITDGFVLTHNSDKMLTSQMRVQGLLTGYIRKIAKAPYSPQEIARFEVPDPDVISFDPDNRSHYKMYYLRVTPVGIARSQEMIALPEGGYDPEAIIYVSETPASLKVGVYPGTNIPFNLDHMIETLSDSRPETVAEAIAHEIQNPVRPGKKPERVSGEDDEEKLDPARTENHGEERTGEIKMKIVSLLKSGLSVAQIVERMGKQVRSQAYQYAKDLRTGRLP